MEKKSLIDRLWSETPRVWKRVQKIALSLLGAVGAVGTVSAVVPNVTTPQWFVSYAWYIVAVLLFIVGYGQTKYVKE
jgi:hypothetical protein